MALANSPAFQATTTRATGKTISSMEMANQFRQTETYIKERGSKIKGKAKESFNLWMAINTMANGNKIKGTEKESFFPRTEIFMMVCG